MPPLGPGGQLLWADVVGRNDLDGEQLSILELACRQRDRADMFAVDAALGDASAARQERESALATTRLLVALRLSDASGKRPAFRGQRVQRPQVGKVSTRDRLRSA